MAEKVINKLKRLSRDLAESVRAELEMAETARSLNKELEELKACISVYVADKEEISADDTISFIKGYKKAKESDNHRQIKFSFIDKNK